MKINLYDAGHMTIKVCSNDYPELTLTYFMARSNFKTWAFPTDNKILLTFH